MGDSHDPQRIFHLVQGKLAKGRRDCWHFPDNLSGRDCPAKKYSFVRLADVHPALPAPPG